MSGWGCPNEVHGQCLRVKGYACDPGMKGCVLHGRFVFANPEKNRPPTRTRLPSSPDEGERTRPDADGGSDRG